METTVLLKEKNISSSEKVRYIKEWILDAEERKLKSDRDLITLETYGPDLPTPEDRQVYGERAEEVKHRQWEAKIHQTRMKIRNEEHALAKLENKLKRYQTESEKPLRPVKKRAWNSKGELSASAVERFEKLRQEKPKWGANHLVNHAYENFPDEIYMIDEDGTKHSSSPSTIKKRLKKYHPGIYYQKK